MTDSADDAIESCRLFRYLSQRERAAVLAGAVVTDIARGAQVLGAQQDGRDIYIVASGMLLASQFARSGREIGYRRLGPGDHFGELAAIDGLPRSANVVALCPARIVRLPAALVTHLLTAQPGFTRALLENLAAMVRSLSARVFEQGAVPAACRLQIEILRMTTAATGGAEAANGSATISSMPTHAEMATLIGAQRELVTRELNRLEARGLIARQGRRLVIPNLSALAGEIERQGGDAGD